MKTVSVLIIEDNWLEAELLRDLISNQFKSHKYTARIDLASTEKSAYKCLSENSYGVVVFDIDLDRRGAGLDLLKQWASKVVVPVISSAREAEEIVSQGFHFGCEHFLRKPIHASKVKTIVDGYLNKDRADNTLKLIKSRFVTQDTETLEQLGKIQECGSVATHLFGPTGVGKQVIAELIHQINVGIEKPFIERNCSAISESLADSILFGHVKGAFTGANENKKGLFELADGGTLFLDEIDKTSIAFQSKLLKVIEQKVITPVGSEKNINVDFKLVTASSQNIYELILNEKFLPDLWMRLQGEYIEIRPLKDRAGDIEFQMKHFIRNHESGRLFIVSDPAMSILNAYDWPGNTRELKTVIDRFQRKNIKILEAHHLDSLKKKTVQRKYSFVTPEILSAIEKNGLPEVVEQIKREVFDYYISGKSPNHRKLMRELNLGTRAFYKLLQNRTSGDVDASAQ